MSVAVANLNSIASDRLQVNDYLETVLPPRSGSVTEAMRYAVLGSGQRLRSILAVRVGRMLGAESAVTIRAAAAVELMHCASLIVDDLPCMDNAQIRRSRPAVHIEFGEATAVLAAFALVALAARSVAEQACFQMRLLSMLDCDNLVGGQALDLELRGDARDQHRSRMTELKTVPLFQLAVEAGTLGASYTSSELQRLLRFGREFGSAYQLMDDYLDGELADRMTVDAQFHRAVNLLDPFGARAAFLTVLLNYLNAKVWEEDHRHR